MSAILDTRYIAIRPEQRGSATNGTARVSPSAVSGYVFSASIPKMLSGANAFEISDIQEERNREPVLTNGGKATRM